MKNKLILAVTLVSMLFASCETTELDLLADPDDVSVDALDPQFLYNGIQQNFYFFVESAADFNSPGAINTRMYNNAGGPTYNELYSPQSFNAIWSNGYAQVLKDISLLRPVAVENNLNFLRGSTNVIRAYTLVTLVDLFGDVPLSEALLGNENLTPNLDSQESVYQTALDDLDEAIMLLSEDEQGLFTASDLFYDGDSESWITAANTLRLKILVTARSAGASLDLDVASEINTLINNGDLIDTNGEDWQLNYGDNRVLPDNRHPAYATFYESDPGGAYVGNYMMWTLAVEKGFDDPRLPWYFYRQDTDATNETTFTLDCQTATAPSQYIGITSQYDGLDFALPFCTTDADRGYWGRDHMDAKGIPDDNNKRTVPGLYPAGGLYDDGSGDSTQNDGTDGALGAGITPILSASMTHFLLAEAALTIGTDGNALDLISDGIALSIAKVQGIAPDNIPVGAIDADANADYIDFVTDEYNAAASDDERLDILAKEFYISLWGNGIEPYNFYRRTGFPSNLQPALEPNPGDFPRLLFYPANAADLNPNINQRVLSEQVFWDTNPAGFID